MSDTELKQNEVEVENVEVAEDASSNMASIASKPTDVSRSELMASLVNYANHVGSKEELAAFVASLPKAAEKTHSNDEIYNSTQHASGDAGKNKASIKSSGAPSESMHSVKEDLALLFGDSSDLSEDFRLKVGTLFEAAVSTRVGIEVSKLEENYEKKLDESVEAIKNEMVENVDNYLNYAVAEWIAENKLAIQSGIRTQVAESFLVGLKDLFDEHYVNIPEDQEDVVESLATKIQELEAQINETTEKNIELSKIVNSKEVKEITDGLAEGMTDTQKDKFAKLIEAVDFSSSEEFRKKASIIKETYFSGKPEVKVVEDRLLSEEVEEPAKSPSLQPDMAAYVSSLSRIVKR